MILGAEIGLLIYGIITLIKGQFGMGKEKKKIYGPKARVLGALCFAPIVLSLMVGMVIGFTHPEATSAGEYKGLIATIEAGLLVGTVVVLIVLSKSFYKQQAQSAQEHSA